MHIQDDRLFVQKDGVRIIDISDQAAPRELGFVSVYGSVMAVQDGIVFVADLDGGLVAFRVD